VRSKESIKRGFQTVKILCMIAIGGGNNASRACGNEDPWISDIFFKDEDNLVDEISGGYGNSNPQSPPRALIAPIQLSFLMIQCPT
jgi:hypothetical protein